MGETLRDKVIRLWPAVAVVAMVLAYHYFTASVGAVLLGSAIVCVAALALGHARHGT